VLKKDIERIDKLFHLSPSKDTFFHIVQKDCWIGHRVGRMKTFTRKFIFNYLFQEEFEKSAGLFEKKFRDKNTYEKFIKITEKDYQSRTSTAIKLYKKKLKADYEIKGLQPVMEFCDLGHDEPELWIQGFLDLKTSKPLIGSVEDLALAYEAIARRTRHFQGPDALESPVPKPS